MKEDFINCPVCGLRNLIEDEKCGGCNSHLKNSNSKITFETNKSKHSIITYVILAIIIIALIGIIFQPDKSVNNNQYSPYDNRQPIAQNNNSQETEHKSPQSFYVIKSIGEFKTCFSKK